MLPRTLRCTCNKGRLLRPWATLRCLVEPTPELLAEVQQRQPPPLPVPK